MALKTDTSFLRFLTMGAKGVRQTMSQLKDMGFKPIELERCCGSNKIWSTKIKRFRLPDLMCVNTGLRMEVRTKSNLAIKMSDAPDNPDRAWDKGLRNDDIVTFIACSEKDGHIVVADKAMHVRIEEMRATVATTRLSAAKSASEGAERDREWATSVPRRDGEVVAVTADKIVVRMYAVDDKAERTQTYQLKEKTPYVSAGDRFRANTNFLSGTPRKLADLSSYLSHSYEPFKDILSGNDVDRYAAVKSFPFRDDDRNQVIAALENNIAREQEVRIRLEAAGSGTFFGSNIAQDTITEFIWDQNTMNELRMEAVLILTEHSNSRFSADILREIASHKSFSGNELRQAAIWGLGKHGLKSYEDVLPFIADEEENVALHAITAFDENTPARVIDQLVHHLLSDDTRNASAASEVLRIIDTDTAITKLINAYDKYEGKRNWIIATLGRMSPHKVSANIGNHPAMKYLEPMFLYLNSTNWLSSEKIATGISFLLKQNIQ